MRGPKHYSLALVGWFPAILLGALVFAPRLAAQSPGGALYAYQPHAGQRASFDEGYRAHLEWHRDHRDSLAWYGWDVVAGRRQGQFVDGTFGISFEALDRRVDPAGDAAHAARSFAGHALPTGQWLVRLRAELSTAAPLESRELGGSLVQVVIYTVALGRQDRFEEVLRRVRDGAERDALFPYTVYETIAGGSDAEFMVLVWRQGMSGFDEARRDPTVVIRSALSGDDRTVLRAESELWQLRRDLTLLPAGVTASAP